MQMNCSALAQQFFESFTNGQGGPNRRGDLDKLSKYLSLCSSILSPYPLPDAGNVSVRVSTTNVKVGSQQLSTGRQGGGGVWREGGVKA